MLNNFDPGQTQLTAEDGINLLKNENLIKCKLRLCVCAGINEVQSTHAQRYLCDGQRQAKAEV